ncbi:mannose-1-phosphate guanylyltransferase/mannose-6-phosphate isomerase [Thermodesulfatator indicus DSM 15286]|uniref:mannose-1-phosphate guanylyltransferase n=1 Tax=Thermodesulfatator indicus (strain DSM 15286 / JCM 11887 / CIR29812) TaxID=667014 RepID=F8ACX0_THEID|nr:mannose-1-phosphate guanylyltransferase/mannose-6-phosphate isomerase [Thermodesulfatator indicus]AEH44764.1 mannose-1-phosphate guanylyltransferase/mannose-6-phosphate isomerase [Thermodesulfatator indicus DSM 15286]
MKAIVLAGGSGTRLWPLSRKDYPKQFLKLNGGKSLLRQTVDRLLLFLNPEDILILTCEHYKFHVKAHLVDLSGYHLLCEPHARNTGPAIAYGFKYALEKWGLPSDEPVLICPSDHLIEPEDVFAETVQKAAQVAKEGFLVTFGITPSRPETGYGYIKQGERLKEVNDFSAYKVARFTEKPDVATAENYLKEGGYYWNAGIFLFTPETFSKELATCAPDIFALYDNDFDTLTSKFAEMPDISIDYALMEKSSQVAVVPLSLYWNDIGSWDALFDVLEKDSSGNAQTGRVITIDTENSMILGQKRLIATIGLEDHLVVETPDAILIVKKGEAQKVSNLVKQLKNEGYPEALEHVTTYRPWGSYTVLEEGPRYKIKRIVVNPGERLSLQMHYHRSEHWVVVRGTAKVQIGDEEIFLHENESVFVPKSTKHRLENPGKIPLEIIEVQNGEYLGEDDIVRFDDVYGRSKK